MIHGEARLGQAILIFFMLNNPKTRCNFLLILIFRLLLIYCCQFWNIVELLSPSSVAPALFGGSLLGYVMYDVTHYYLHHGQPTSEVSRNLKVRAVPVAPCIVV